MKLSTKGNTKFKEQSDKIQNDGSGYHRLDHTQLSFQLRSKENLQNQKAGENVNEWLSSSSSKQQNLAALSMQF